MQMAIEVIEKTTGMNTQERTKYLYERSCEVVSDYMSGKKLSDLDLRETRHDILNLYGTILGARALGAAFGWYCDTVEESATVEREH